MILYLKTAKSSNTLRYLHRDWARDLRKRMRQTTYEEVLRKGELPAATLLFTDHERMDPAMLSRVRDLWDEATAQRRALNNPHHILARHALLKRLNERGVNSHRAFRVPEIPADLRFPVFVRGERDHLGPATGLLESRASLEAAIADLQPQRSDLLVVEFEETRDPDGKYRKYSAFRVGEAIIPRHVLVGPRWVGKFQLGQLADARADEPEYMRTNPHEKELREAFDVACIEYGRIDYGLRNGKIVVWEINTNPTVMTDWWRMPRWRRPLLREFVRRYVAALEALDP